MALVPWMPVKVFQTVMKRYWLPVGFGVGLMWLFACQFVSFAGLERFGSDGMGAYESDFAALAYLSAAIASVVAAALTRFVRWNGLLPVLFVGAMFGPITVLHGPMISFAERNRADMRAAALSLIRGRLPGLPLSQWTCVWARWDRDKANEGSAGFGANTGIDAAVAAIREKVPGDWVELKDKNDTEFLSPLDGSRRDAIDVCRVMDCDIRIWLGSEAKQDMPIPNPLVRVDGKRVPETELESYGVNRHWTPMPTNIDPNLGVAGSKLRH